MTEELFGKYIDRLCDQHEIQLVEQWLNTVETSELDAILSRLWDAEYPPMPEQQTQALLTRLRIETSAVIPGAFSPALPFRTLPPRALPLWRRGRSVAAAIAIPVLLAVGWIWIRKSVPPPPQIVQAKPANAGVRTAYVDVYNERQETKNIRLDDGTEVSLSGYARLKYPASFGSVRREVYLESGKAIFKVAKDESRPFTVYRGELAIKALGTSFIVHSDNNGWRTSVLLIQGKVVVHDMKTGPGVWADVYLSPGEEVVYDSQRKMIPEHFWSHQYHHARESNEDTAFMTFSNAPLPEVLERLMKHYHRHISYERSALDGMDFTGSIAHTDSLGNILNIVAKMNGLQVIQDGGDGFTIIHSPH